MGGSGRNPIELKPGTRLADVVTRGIKAFDRGDAAGGDAAYREAVARAPVDDPTLWSQLTADHVVGLRSLGKIATALTRCAEYLRAAGGNHVSLRLLQAETHAMAGDRVGVDADLGEIRTDSLTPEEVARRHRLEGLSAAHWHRYDDARRHLGEARRAFHAIGDRCGVETVDRDLRRVDLLGDPDDGPPPETVSDHVLRAQVLRGRWRYEEAILELRQVSDRELDPALRFPVLYELIVLHHLVANHKEAKRLIPALREAANLLPDSATKRASVDWLASPSALGSNVATTLDQQLHHARRLIADARLDDGMVDTGKLDDAEQRVRELAPRLRRDHQIATWHLAQGEIALARGFPQAVLHLRMAADHATEIWLADIRIRAVRLIGDAHVQRAQAHAQAGEQALADAADRRAAEHWAHAHHLEEQVASSQLTDATWIRMLHAVPDEHDQRIRVAATALGQRGPEAAAAVVVAMEAARGSAILGRILGGKDAAVRALPSPSDQRGAWEWVQNMTDELPPTQVVWLLHATPDRVHHALIGRGLLWHASVPCDRNELTRRIDSLTDLWKKGDLKAGPFDRLLTDVASLICIDSVIPALSPHVRRIAIVAGGALSEVPFAAITFPRGAEPIGLRYALSDLPCLRARLPLHQRSRRLRGGRRLVISPPAAYLAPAGSLRGDTVLPGTQATRQALHDVLSRHRHRHVRIDSHGKHDPEDPTRSWLELAPDVPGGPAGRLEAEELQEMDLSECGTLVLGACESGMAQRIGRDERIGFARAAFHAGAASVVAARWEARDWAAATVLDGFDRYARYLPRDVALQRAQLDARHKRRIGAHPALWACWTLYGDPGFQTRAGRFRHWLHRCAEELRSRATRR